VIESRIKYETPSDMGRDASTELPPGDFCTSQQLSAAILELTIVKVLIPIPQLQWLKSVAQVIVKTIPVRDPLYPNEDEDDKVYLYHRAVLYIGFLYKNLREAIRYENGPQIIKQWSFWPLHFLGKKRKNYSTEAANVLATLAADWSLEIAYMQTHCRTVNMMRKSGCGKPIDQVIEHYNLAFLPA
jgi:hypothetical protein